MNNIVKALLGVMGLCTFLFGLGVGHTKLTSRDDTLEAMIVNGIADDQLAAELRLLYQTTVDAELAKIEADQEQANQEAQRAALERNSLHGSVERIEKDIEKVIEILEKK